MIWRIAWLQNGATISSNLIGSFRHLTLKIGKVSNIILTHFPYRPHAFWRCLRTHTWANHKCSWNPANSFCLISNATVSAKFTHARGCQNFLQSPNRRKKLKKPGPHLPPRHLRSPTSSPDLTITWNPEARMLGTLSPTMYASAACLLQWVRLPVKLDSTGLDMNLPNQGPRRKAYMCKRE